MLQNLKNWINDPFDADMSVARWFAFVGLIIVSAIAWRLIIGHLRD